MQVEFDHLVHYCQNPDDTMDKFYQKGFNALKGGMHNHWGTKNTLCYFQNLSYIEWITIINEDISRKAENPLIKQLLAESKEGFSQLAFRTENIGALAKQIIKKGLKVIGPLPGSRRKEDGTTLQWSMLFIKDKVGEIPYPFFIQWGNSKEQRRIDMKEMLNQGKIKYISILVKDPFLLASQWNSLFGLQENIQLIHDSAYGDYIEIQISNVFIRFYQTTDNTKGIFQCGIETNGMTNLTGNLLQVSGGTYLIK